MSDDVMSRVIRVIAETQHIPAEGIKAREHIRGVEDRLARRHQHRLRHRERVRNQHPDDAAKSLRSVGDVAEGVEKLLAGG